MPRITKRVVEAAEIRPTEYFIWCNDLPGFGVRIYPSGRRAYLVQYRVDGRSRRAKIGLHGPLTVDEARRQGMVLLGQVASGTNPAEERATHRSAMTVAELCQRYRAALDRGLIMGKRGLPKKPSTIETDIGRIERHIMPLLGGRRVKDLTRSDIVRFVRDVLGGKTATIEKTGKLRGKAIVRGGPGAAARASGLLGGILSFAVAEGVIESNPAFGVAKPGHKPRAIRLSPDEYRALGKALDAAVDRSVNPTAIAAVRLMALTGCRRGEILGLRWKEVDEAGHAFRLVDSKEGRSVRPIGEPAFRILSTLARLTETEWVLPGERRDLPYGGLTGVWRDLVRNAGQPELTPHGLRHGFASVAGDMGYSEPTIGALLGHAAGSVTGRYTHILDSVLVAAADRVSRTIWDFMTGETFENGEDSPDHRSI